MTLKIEDTQKRLDESVAKCVNLNTQLEVAKQRISDMTEDLQSLQEQLQHNTAKLQKVTDDFSSKDKESLRLSMSHAEAEKELRAKIHENADQTM